MQLVNLTPHEITIQLPDGSKYTISPSGKVARVKTKQQIIDSIPLTGIRDNEDNDYTVPIVKTELREVDGLPKQCENCKNYSTNWQEFYEKCPHAWAFNENPENPPVPEVCEYQEPKAIYIVSSLVAQAVAGRNDVVAPDAGPTAIRNEQGQIVAVTRFQRW